MRRFHAPGRVNLIGEHTDYSGGLALPGAIDRGVTLTVHGPAPEIRLRSDREDGVVALPADGGGEAEGWGRYVAALAAELAEAGRPSVGLEGELTSDVPSGAGLSSSAALAVAVALGLCAVADFEPGPAELVTLCVRAEGRMGVPSGPLDQAASVFGRADELVLLDCATLAHERVPFPDELELVLVDSAVSHSHESSGYGDRRAELEAALAARRRGDDPGEVGARRLRHVAEENERVRRTAALLRDPAGADRTALGALLADSHASLRDLYEVSTPELDLLVELAGEEGAIGARMMGGGFGGAILAVAERGEGAGLGERVARRYRERHPELEARAIACSLADGAREL